MTTAPFTLLAVLLVLAAAYACQLLGHLDNRLEADMLADPEPSFPARVRHWLGLDDITGHLRRIEDTMATITDALNALATQVNAVSAAQATSFHNLQAAIDKLKSGELTADQQDAVDQIEKSLTTIADDATKADDGFEPADDNGGNTPPANGGDTPVVPGGDVPVDGGDTGDQPVVNAKR